MPRITSYSILLRARFAEGKYDFFILEVKSPAQVALI